MLRVILLLCFTLASCQQATAVWPFATGERSSSSNVDYGNTVNSAIPSYVSYVSNSQQSTQPQLLNAESDVVSFGQLGITTEGKPTEVVNHGVKGVNRYPTPNKGTAQQPIQQSVFFTSQPANIFSEGYLEPVAVGTTSNTKGINVITGTLNFADGKDKESGFFRYIFPWNWVNRKDNAAAPLADESSVQQPSAPKRSWLWPFKTPNRNSIGQQTAANCFCIPTNYQPQAVTPHYSTDHQQPQSQQSPKHHISDVEPSPSIFNVQPVEPSGDFDRQGSNPVAIVVPAPSQEANGQQQAQQQQQTQVVNGGTDTDLLANHRPQQSQQQQQQQQQTQQFVQQFQTVPVMTNYQSAPQHQPAETGSQQTNTRQVANTN